MRRNIMDAKYPRRWKNSDGELTIRKSARNHLITHIQNVAWSDREVGERVVYNTYTHTALTLRIEFSVAEAHGIDSQVPEVK